MKELRGFRRISLDPGQTEIVEFKLDFDELTFLNRDMRRTIEPSTFKSCLRESVDLQEVTLSVVAKQSFLSCEELTCVLNKRVQFVGWRARKSRPIVVSRFPSIRALPSEHRTILL